MNVAVVTICKSVAKWSRAHLWILAVSFRKLYSHLYHTNKKSYVCTVLHPEDMWQRRRSSSGSENSEISVRSFPQSLPTSRKNSIITDPLLAIYHICNMG